MTITSRLRADRIGLILFGAGAIIAGVADVAFGSLDPAHQPIQAWGDNIPGTRAIAYVLASFLIVGGATILRRRSAPFGAMTLTFVYAVFAIFWLPRFYTAPRVLGFGLRVYLGVLGGVCEQLIVIAAAILVYARANPPRYPVVVYGLCAIVFGCVHLSGIQANTPYVPGWMPFGQPFWVVFTGLAFILAGVAILLRFLDILASQLLGVMWLVFSAFTLVPGLIAAPRELQNWGGNAYNLVAAGSAFILAGFLARTSDSHERVT